METSEPLWVSSGRGGHPSLHAGVFGWTSHPVQGMLVSELVVAGGGIMRDVGAQTQPFILILQLNFIIFHPTFSCTWHRVLSLLPVPDRAVPEQSRASNMLESSVVMGALSLWLAGAAMSQLPFPLQILPLPCWCWIKGCSSKGCCVPSVSVNKKKRLSLFPWWWESSPFVFPQACETLFPFPVLKEPFQSRLRIVWCESWSGLVLSFVMSSS